MLLEQRIEEQDGIMDSIVEIDETYVLTTIKWLDEWMEEKRESMENQLRNEDYPKKSCAFLRKLIELAVK